jgi:hypothetical protein
MASEPVHGAILGIALTAASPILPVIPGRMTAFEVALPQPLATFPARERRLRRVDLLTWLRLIRGLISE